jgi:hypothetical protein
MEKVEKSSFDWDNFNAADNNDREEQRSEMSDMWNSEKRAASEQSVVRSIEDSRNVMEISVNNDNHQKSFHFEK